MQFCLIFTQSLLSYRIGYTCGSPDFAKLLMIVYMGSMCALFGHFILQVSFIRTFWLLTKCSTLMLSTLWNHSEIYIPSSLCYAWYVRRNQTTTPSSRYEQTVPWVNYSGFPGSFAFTIWNLGRHQIEMTYTNLNWLNFHFLPQGCSCVLLPEDFPDEQRLAAHSLLYKPFSINYQVQYDLINWLDMR